MLVLATIRYIRHIFCNNYSWAILFAEIRYILLLSARLISDPPIHTTFCNPIFIWFQTIHFTLNKDWIFRKYLKKNLEHKNSLETWKQLWSHCVQLRSLGGIQVQFFGPPMIWGFPSNLSYEVRLYIQSVVCNSWA